MITERARSSGICVFLFACFDLCVSVFGFVHLCVFVCGAAIQNVTVLP